jgi:AhpD family alkylhydroperoxidase
MPRIQPKDGSAETINIFKTMDHSPAFLEAFKSFKGKASGNGTLSEQLQEKLALTAAGVNKCNYCKAAHTFLAKKAGLSDGCIAEALEGRCSDDDKDHAALQFSMALIEKRGHIDNADFAAVKDAGYTDQEVVEIFGQTMINMVTNYFNEFIQTDVDF